MKWDILLYTRTKEYDYRWICKPSYMGRMVEVVREKLVDLRMSSISRQFSPYDWKHNFMFLEADTYCGIYRTINGEYTDHVGRDICAVEGVVCPIKDKALFCVDLPNIIVNLLVSDITFQQRLMQEGVIDNTIDVENIINPLKECTLNDDIIGKLSEAESASLSKLMYNISSCKGLDNFVFGEKAVLYERMLPKEFSIRDVYDGKDDMLKNYAMIGRGTFLEFKVLEEQARGTVITLLLKMEREKGKKYSYQWLVLPVIDNQCKGKAIYKSDKLFFEKELNISELSRQVSLIKAYLQYIGWQEVDKEQLMFMY